MTLQTLAAEQLDAQQLNKVFALQDTDNTLNFKTGEGGIPVVEITNQHASATISLQGAHLLRWKPKGEDEVIWLSEKATFAPGKSVRDRRAHV